MVINMISVKKNLCRLGVLSSSLLLLTAATTPSVIAFADIQTSAIKIIQMTQMVCILFKVMKCL